MQWSGVSERKSQYLIWDFIHQQLSAVTLRCILMIPGVKAMWAIERFLKCVHVILVWINRTVNWWNVACTEEEYMCTVYTSFSLLTKTIICDIFVDVPVTLYRLSPLFSVERGWCFEHFGYDENVLCLWTLWFWWKCALFMNTLVRWKCALFLCLRIVHHKLGCVCFRHALKKIKSNK